METLRMLITKENGQNDTDFKQQFKDLGLQLVYSPFWANLPHADILQSHPRYPKHEEIYVRQSITDMYSLLLF
jgi:hypothetical protein